MKNFLGVFGSGGANAITDKDQKSTKKRPVTMEIKFEHEIERGLNQYGIKEWAQYEHD
jgi:hypothetical protein